MQACTIGGMTETAYDILTRILARGISQAEISRRTGIKATKLSRWSIARSLPDGADDALKLAALDRELAAEIDDAAPCSSEPR